MPPTNQRLQVVESLFNDLSEEEAMLLQDCMKIIKRHIEKNIRMATNADQLDRLLIFKSAMF